MRVKKSTLLAPLPPEWPHSLLPAIQAQVKAAGTKIVILDDDPTGGQTIHDVAVLTESSISALKAAFAEEDAVVDVLTNSRSMPLDAACTITRQVTANCKAASAATGRDFVIVSRSDSTLRGHYPGEVEALIDALDRPVDGVLVIPFFLEGGRITANDTHYVTESGDLTPVGKTEYARDATFAYRNSNLRAWVSEKHGGRIQAEDVVSVSLWDVRVGGPDAVAAKLRQLSNKQVCVVNALTYRDLEVFVTGLLLAEAPQPHADGKYFVYRTAASFVRARGGIAPRTLLTTAELGTGTTGKGGLIVVGSHVNRTTQQMQAARTLPNLHSIEVSVSALLDAAQCDTEIKRVATRSNAHLRVGEDVMLYTSRQAATGPGPNAALDIGQRISAALVRIVQAIAARPAWVIAKGGITASDIATHALALKRARVLGQAIPGVPIWRTGAKSRWPHLVYVVFPGNVGGPEALADMVRTLRGSPPR